MWIWASVTAALIATFELFLLDRRRRMFLLDPQRRRFLVRHSHPRAQSQFRQPRKDAPAAPEGVDDFHQAAQCPPAVALLYVDSEGRCAAANEAARRLLHWREQQVRLSDVLSGIGEDIALLVDRVAREAVVERYPAVLRGPLAIPAEISAIALRDRDGNFWGAALFVRMRGSDVTPEDSAAAPSPRLSSTGPLGAASARP